MPAHLFGSRRGSYTGAVEDHAGVFEQAHTGTLFLDEIATWIWSRRGGSCWCSSAERSPDSAIRDPVRRAQAGGGTPRTWPIW